MAKKIFKPKVVVGTPELIGYKRLSQDSRTSKSHSFKTQEKVITQKARSLFGDGQFRLTFLEDNGKSGTYGMTPTELQPKIRPTLQIIADAVIAGKCNGVITYLQSRLFRNQRGLRELVEDVLVPHGVPLYCCGKDIDIFNEISRLQLYEDGLDDERYSAEISVRIVDANDLRSNEGFPVGQVGYGWVSGYKPLGLDDERPGITPDEEQKLIVLWMVERYMAGWNCYRIAGWLNEHGVPSPLCSGKWEKKAALLRERDGHEPLWRSGTVWNILKNPLHAGLTRRKVDGELQPGVHWEQRFYEPEVLAEILRAKDDRAKFKTGTGRKNAPHILNGLVHCERCGMPLRMGSTSATTSEHRAYVCLNGEVHGKKTCPGVTVRAQWVEEAVVEKIAELAQHPVMQRLMASEVAAASGKQIKELTDERIKLRAAIAKSDEQFERWADSYTSGTVESLSSDRFNKYIRTLEEKSQKAAKRLAEVDKLLESSAGHDLWLQQLQKTLRDFPVVWGKLDNDERKNVLNLLLEEGKVVADRVEGHVLLKFKLHFLPPVELRLLYSTMRGISRTKATGIQRLTAPQMAFLYYSDQGKSDKECAQLLESRSISSFKRTLLNNLEATSWQEVLDMTREKVQENFAQLPLAGKTKGADSGKKAKPEAVFLSPVLMEVFQLFAIGANSPEAAARLQLSVTTVQGRRARILKIFGTSSMLTAVEKAREMGIL